MAANDRATAAYAEGVAFQAKGLLGAAMESWRRALAFNPLHREALFNLAIACGISGNTQESFDLYQKLLALDPFHREALYNLANAKMRLRAFGEAELIYQRLTEAHPQFAAGWVNCALAMAARNDLQSAEAFMRRGLALTPEHVVSHWNLSHMLLAQERWAEGWTEYEWRLKSPGWIKPPVEAAAWKGGFESAQRILVWNDQGLGDAIMFFRYLNALAQRQCEIWLFVQPPLRRLFERQKSVRGVLCPETFLKNSPGNFDAQTPLASLPLRLGLHDRPPLWNGSYIHIDHKIGRSERRKRIGLVWSGNPAHQNDHARSVKLHTLAPLFDLPDIEWVSLQLGAAAAQIEDARLASRLENMAPFIRDMADTGEVIATLDVVITVDTSVAHLAGAMGKECWLMLPEPAEWRWGGNREKTVWYPSIKLFRQETPGDWDQVVKNIAGRLRG